MTDLQARYGTDLRLLGDLERQNDRNGGGDLLTYTRPQTSLVDLQTLQDVRNLQQALLLRFLTRQGDLTQLGHPDYGSRLCTLIGELNNATNRNRAKLFVLEALAAEPRVRSVISVDVTAGARDRVDISVSLIAIQSDTPLNLVFPFFLGGRQ
jgi:phage baseplate assembly protein W